MASDYNPIVRTFCRLRADLVNDFGVPRECVRPTTRIDDLLPDARQRGLWFRFRWWLRRAGMTYLNPPNTTVGDVVIYLTRFGDHKGYRFSRNEIALKVRFIVAERFGLPASRIREENSFLDLDNW